MNTKIHRRCTCGCKEVAGLGKRWVWGHNGCTRMSKETRKKMSLSAMDHEVTKETKFKMSLSSFKYNPNDEYCDVWKDREYVKDLRKDYCESINCKGIYKRLSDHHINLNKKDCRPSNVITLCTSCHVILHWKLSGRYRTNSKDFVTIIRKDRITYIHKETRRKVILFKTHEQK